MSLIRRQKTVKTIIFRRIECRLNTCANFGKFPVIISLLHKNKLSGLLGIEPFRRHIPRRSFADLLAYESYDMGKKNKRKNGPSDGSNPKRGSAPSSIDIRVIGTGNAGTPKSFMVNMDHFRSVYINISFELV